MFVLYVALPIHLIGVSQTIQENINANEMKSWKTNPISTRPASVVQKTKTFFLRRGLYLVVDFSRLLMIMIDCSYKI